MALTHVCIWKDKSWKRITAYEAARLFPYGTSAHSGLFMCELCGQYVTLINGSIQSSHFRHSAHEKNKDCEDRSETYTYSNFFKAETHDLPVKLNIRSQNDFSFSIGFISLPDSLMTGKQNRKIIILAPEKYVYSFDRLKQGTITYLDVGNTPVEKYNITVSPAIERVSLYWPSVITGVDKRGTLFDKASGKKLPYDADVQVGREYYLLTAYSQYGTTKSINKKEICSKTIGWSTWRVYEVKATEFSEEAAKFFLNIHCRLTDKPVTMYPIWPVYTRSPYVIYHKGAQYSVFFSGNADPMIAPSGSITKYPRKDPKVLRVSSGDRQQLLSAGRTDVLQYMYFWESELDQKAECPGVSVVDLNGNSICVDSYEALPYKNTICITPEVDGIIEIHEKGFLVERYTISAKTRFEYDSVQYNKTIKIYQGLDCVWVVSYKKRTKSDEGSEQILLSKLVNASGESVKASHSLGALAERFAPDSPIRSWLYRQIKNGVIKQNAIKLLHSYVCGEKV